MNSVKMFQKQDKKKVESGVWVPIAGDFEVLVGKIGAPGNADIVRKILRPFRAQMECGKLPPGKDNELTCEIMSKTTLRGWRGNAENFFDITEPLGDYTPDRGAALLLEFEDFREIVAKLSEDRALFAAESLEPELGNLKRTSGGSSNGASTSL